MRFIYLIPFLFLSLLCTDLPANSSQQFHNGKISELHLDNSIVPAKIISNLNCRIGKECSFQQINKDIHELMNLGVFENVIVTINLSNNNNVVTYSFIESPIIAFWSNNVHKCKLIPNKRLFTTQRGKHFNPANWFNDQKKIIDFYNKHHFHNVKIFSKTNSHNNLIELFTDVYPHKKSFVDCIKLTGAGASYESDVLALLHCKPKNFWLFRNGAFDPDKFKSDKINIQNFFINIGFLDVNVNISLTNSAKPNRVTVLVNVCKGPQYRLGTLIWNQQLLSSDNFKILKDELKFPLNTAYSPELTEMIRNIINKYCVKLSSLQPYLSIMPIISENSEPNNPIVDIIITLRNSQIGFRNSTFSPPTFSYPASLANEYLNQ